MDRSIQAVISGGGYLFLVLLPLNSYIINHFNSFVIKDPVIPVDISIPLISFLVSLHGIYVLDEYELEKY